MDHTKEPWKVTRKNGTCIYIGTADGRTLAIFGGYGTAQAQRDSRRVLDLVNATAGLSIQEVRRWANRTRVSKTGGRMRGTKG